MCKKRRRTGDSDTRNKNIEDIGMEFNVEKCTMHIMKSEKDKLGKE